MSTLVASHDVKTVSLECDDDGALTGAIQVGGYFYQIIGLKPTLIPVDDDTTLTRTWVGLDSDSLVIHTIEHQHPDIKHDTLRASILTYVISCLREHVTIAFGETFEHWLSIQHGPDRVRKRKFVDIDADDYAETKAFHEVWRIVMAENWDVA